MTKLNKRDQELDTGCVLWAWGKGIQLVRSNSFEAKTSGGLNSKGRVFNEAGIHVSNDAEVMVFWEH